MTGRPRRPVEIARRVLGFPRLVLGHRDLIATTVKRELQVRFTGTVLGWFWPLLHPLFLFAVYHFIFTKLLGFKFGDALPKGQESAFGIYMFVGILVWAAFGESLMRGTNVIVDNGNLIKKLAFPSEVLPLNIVLVGIVTMLFGIVMFVLACVTTPVWVAPGPALLWIPLLLLLQALFTYGLLLFLSTLQVFLRDTLQIVSIVVTVWMFVTPLFWAPELVGAAVDPYMPIVTANPMFHLVYAYRVVLMSSQPSEPINPFTHDFGTSVAIFAVWSVAAFVLGYAFFVLCQRRFADEV